MNDLHPQSNEQNENKNEKCNEVSIYKIEVNHFLLFTPDYWCYKDLEQKSRKVSIPF